jgi:fatty-acyl-CoA synthase
MLDSPPRVLDKEPGRLADGEVMSIFARIRKESSFVGVIGKALVRVTPMALRRTYTFPDVVEQLAGRFSDRAALISDRETFTYAQFYSRGNRYARWARANGIAKGDTVCLLMPNRPEFVAIWLGITRMGGVVALLNTNLSGAALAHCINIVAPKHVIVAAELAAAFAGAEPLMTVSAEIWSHGEAGSGRPRIDEAVMTFDDGPIAKSDRPEVTLDDRCLFVYTSGTTGLPKAANVNHYRVRAAMEAFSAIMGVTANDRMYNCLPLYHTSGGVIAVCAALREGGSVFITEKFSARQFWDDVVDNDCTLFQYIGELCRYLVNAPPHPKENRHKLRLCCGNGLRPDIWETFRNRFGIDDIREFYAATEGNAILFNIDNTPGSIGRVPKWAEFIFPLSVVRFDVDKEELVRGEDGFCQECAPDEIGELVSRILVSPLKPGQRFDGYSDKAATEKKILRGAFEADDMWFRSGDLVRRDAQGYFYFVDRVGDTFRWKGENVATSEVAELIHTFDGVQEANVYGVPVAGREGKAGMVAMVVGEDFDFAAFRGYLQAHLSPYARPLFVRLQREIETTSTFKQRKLELVRDGYDPAKVSDPLYFDDASAGAYVPLDAELFRRIQAADIRL